MMNKEYDFLRQLTGAVTEEQLRNVIPFLLEEEIEVYFAKETDAYRLVTSVSELEDGSLFVTAADEERAREILMGQGAEELLCPKMSVAEHKNEAQLATEAYVRRQKSTYLQWLVVIILFLCYIIVKQFM